MVLFKGIPLGTKEISDITEILGSLYTVENKETGYSTQGISRRFFLFLECSFCSFGVNKIKEERRRKKIQKTSARRIHLPSGSLSTFYITFLLMLRYATRKNEVCCTSKVIVCIHGKALFVFFAVQS